MRIAHVVDYFHTDVGYQEYYLALAQARAGHDVWVVTSQHRHHALGTSGEDAARGQAALDDAGVTCVRLDARQLGHDRAYSRHLAGTVEDIDPDAIHCHHSFAPTTVLTARAATRVGASLLVDNHIQSRLAPAASTPLGRAYYGGFRAAFGARLRRRVDCWVANGPYEREFLAERMGLAFESVELIPLGFDRAVFAFDEGRRHEARGSYGWSADDLVVAVTGKLHAGKRVDLVAAACERALPHLPVRLVLAGTIDEPTRSAVDGAASRLRAAGRLHVGPMLPTPALAQLYLAADVVTFARLPSISIYEAAGTGALVLVGQDAFADWLAGLCPTIRSVDPARLDLVAVARSLDADARPARAEGAASAFSWPVISSQFVAKYERRGCASSS